MVIKRSITSIVIKVEFSLNESIFYDQTLKFIIINFYYVINLTQKIYLFTKICLPNLCSWIQRRTGTATCYLISFLLRWTWLGTIWRSCQRRFEPIPASEWSMSGLSRPPSPLCPACPATSSSQPFRLVVIAMYMVSINQVAIYAEFAIS